MALLKESRIKKIGVFRALQLGDMICAVPAVRSLKSAIPDSEITLIGLPWAKEFTDRFSYYFSHFISFPGYPGLPEQKWSASSFTEFLQQVSKVKFDLIIQMHGNGSIINPMIHLLGAKKTAGFYKEPHYRPDEKLFMEYPDDLPEIYRHLELMKFLGASEMQAELEFPIDSQEELSMKKLLKRYKLEENEYVCMHCGARDERKWWSIKNFVEIGDYISQKNLQVVLTGTESESKIIKEVENRMRFPAINLAGKTDLGTLAAIVKSARMLFSNDTGVSHIAAAVKTPSVIVFLFSDPVRWAPLNKSIHEVILPEDSADLEMIKAKVNKVLGRNFRKDCSIEPDNIKLKTGS